MDKPEPRGGLRKSLSFKALLGWWSGLMLVVTLMVMLNYWLIGGRSFFYGSPYYIEHFGAFILIWGLGAFGITMSAILNRLNDIMRARWKRKEQRDHES